MKGRYVCQSFSCLSDPSVSIQSQLKAEATQGHTQGELNSTFSEEDTIPRSSFQSLNYRNLQLY